MKRPLRILLLVAAAAALSSVAFAALAQEDGENVDSFGAALDEERAWAEAQEGHHIKARELAERVVRGNPRSFIAHFVLGFVHHYGEANFAKALYHHNRAYRLFAEEHDDPPTPPAPWMWHARIMRELVATHGDLEHYDDQLRWMARYSELYEPDYIAERAWPFMKLRRFDDAREAALLGRATNEPRQVEIALNALCAVEFEAGDEQASYSACREAMELHGGDPERQGAVDFTNFAEAARSVFALDECERVDLLATRAQVSWYGNPWVELAELYVRAGRFIEALDALRRVNEYRDQRPPHVRDSDRNEGRRALASFFLVIGRAQDAARLSEKALNAPDRRAHNSRDPAQDQAIAALVSRAALRLRAEQRYEESIGKPWYERVWAWTRAQRDRFDGWVSGRVAARNLADEERLVGTFMIGTHRSAVMPPWLVGELTHVLGAGVLNEAVRRARREDDRQGSDAYYDAFEAEATLAGGDPSRARRLAQRAIDGLAPAEALLRARMLAVSAEASRDLHDTRAATQAYGDAFQADPGVFRRMGLAVPIRMEVRGGASAEDIAEHVADSPRFDVSDWGLVVRVQPGSACLTDESGAILACAEPTPSPGRENTDAFNARVAREFHERVFAPRIDLSQTDANGLDGSNRLSRDPLRTLFGHEAAPREP